MRTWVMSMAPLPDAVPEFRATARLRPSGRPKGAFAADVRRVSNLRNTWTVLFAWVQVVVPIVVAVNMRNPLVWVVAFLLVGRGFALLAILGHEAAHKLLFTSRFWNDNVGKWLLEAPAFVPLEVYRYVHLTHHRDELGATEPDLGLYAGYPVSAQSFRRKLRRDATGESGWKNLKPLLQALGQRPPRRQIWEIALVQMAIFGVFWAVGWPQLYLLMWLLPWMTVWRVLNRLRAIAEHGGLAASDDRRLTSHHMRQSVWARFWIVPYNTGWHVAHHVDTAVPFRNLPRFHQALVDDGWYPDTLTWTSYTAFWRTASGARSLPPNRVGASRTT
ncbi:MAG: fatty acid desaturase [Actinobacteria bacterium]|nr:fatty acid desaturase [Actinomycetota bacterium]